MLTQGEYNFYGFNPNNIIKRANRGRVSVVLRYDANNRYFVVTRRTPRTFWEDRYKTLDDARKRYFNFLYRTSAKLEKNIF
jgi:hypothetical protein